MAACLGILCALPACRQVNEAEPSFYFWRTNARLSTGERAALKQLEIRKLYLRFFDVDTRRENGSPEPLGTVDSLDALPADLSLIPVVFITNRTFLRMQHDTEAINLAGKLLRKIQSLKASFRELQIDCDWSEHTKTRYFLLLSTLKKQLPASTLLSATIRLHQVKYPVRSGVPPVDRGMLMFYNMGRLQDEQGPNSIFDAATASAYTPYIKSYRLPLDVALPIFRWCVHYRNGRVKALLGKKQFPPLEDTSYFYGAGDQRFRVKHDGMRNGVAFRAGDVLKYEEVNDERLLEAARLLRQNLPETRRSIVLYDLDEQNLKAYEKQTLPNVYSAFR